jgi:chorismate mutase
MVSLLVATTSDPASINPANALLAMPGWQPGPHFQVQTQKPVFFMIHFSQFIYLNVYFVVEFRMI